MDGEYNYSSYYTYNDVETVLAKRVGEVDIYHVDHHGSKHSSGEVFISTLKPSVSLCSCGNNNTYGHPVWVLHHEALLDLGCIGLWICTDYDVRVKSW